MSPRTHRSQPTRPKTSTTRGLTGRKTLGLAGLARVALVALVALTLGSSPASATLPAGPGALSAAHQAWSQVQREALPSSDPSTWRAEVRQGLTMNLYLLYPVYRWIIRRDEV